MQRRVGLLLPRPALRPRTVAALCGPPRLRLLLAAAPLLLLLLLLLLGPRLVGVGGRPQRRRKEEPPQLRRAVRGELCLRLPHRRFEQLGEQLRVDEPAQRAPQHLRPLLVPRVARLRPLRRQEARAAELQQRVLRFLGRRQLHREETLLRSLATEQQLFRARRRPAAAKAAGERRRLPSLHAEGAQLAASPLDRHAPATDRVHPPFGELDELVEAVRRVHLPLAARRRPDHQPRAPLQVRARAAAELRLDGELLRVRLARRAERSVRLAQLTAER
mmetsp:Transcript_22432/g.72230  ORF Transcript_22432/g.72230 Transcript_22432/m.72230 type:complete len:276 (+) Transcript_22432:1300-2127(+)